MATKSNRSSGTQPNARGVTQGVTLVDPVSGLPVSVVDDSGTKRLAVDAKITAQIGELEVELDYETDSVAIGDPNSNILLKINPDGSLDANTEVDAADGDNIFMVGSEDGTILGTRHVARIGSDLNLRVRDDDANLTLSNIENAISDIDLNTDQIEALIAETNTKLDTLISQTDTLETNTLNIANNTASIDSKLNTLGQKNMAGSVPVVLANDQSSIPVSDVINTAGVHGAITVTTTATPVRVGGSNLANRKSLTAYKNGSGTIYWGYDNTVTTATGTPFTNNQFSVWALGPDVTVYMIANNGSHNVRVTESA